MQSDRSSGRKVSYFVCCLFVFGEFDTLEVYQRVVLWTVSHLMFWQKHWNDLMFSFRGTRCPSWKCWPYTWLMWWLLGFSAELYSSIWNNKALWRRCFLCVFVLEHGFIIWLRLAITCLGPQMLPYRHWAWLGEVWDQLARTFTFFCVVILQEPIILTSNSDWCISYIL